MQVENYRLTLPVNSNTIKVATISYRPRAVAQRRISIKMNLKLKNSASTDNYMLAYMFVVFQDYLNQTTAEEFQRRFGPVGTEHLAMYTEPK